jgi:anti-sigma regulatory factor (Ser/Thr protein kinase)
MDVTPVARFTAPVPPHPATGVAWASTWPRQDSMELGAYVTAPGSARGHVRNVLREWGLGHHEEVAQLVISELVTNSVQAVLARLWPEVPPIRLWLLGDASRVMLLVWDALPGMPTPPSVPAGSEEENGRGLFLAGHLSDLGGYLPPEYYGGKVMWALLPKIQQSGGLAMAASWVTPRNSEALAVIGKSRSRSFFTR